MIYKSAFCLAFASLALALSGMKSQAALDDSQSSSRPNPKVVSLPVWLHRVQSNATLVSQASVMKLLKDGEWLRIETMSKLPPLTPRETALARYYRASWMHLINANVSDYEILGIASLEPSHQRRYAELFHVYRNALLQQTIEFEKMLQQVISQQNINQPTG